MTKLLLVGAGGLVGSMLRYGISLLMLPWTSKFPWSTLSINILGCFLIGLAVPLLKGKPEWQVLVVPGLLGGFTTFSAFGNETQELVKAGTPALAGMYVAASVGLGLAAVWIGRGLAE
ncbi:MAG TPA: fluoride efflux transporter CrcB [Planctomycetota bacterium]|nr:fluoride efflux transporter CrcB [Planctomycetota bacterium]